MKKLLFSLTILAALSASAQTQTSPTTLDGWASRLQLFGQKVPQEQVFVHMDNTSYFLGDTIYFKAYLRRSDSGAPSQLSGILYAELLNQDGYLVERQLIEMKNGQGVGSFCLPDTLYGGYYELRAYTRWQLNWGEFQHPHTSFAEKWFFNQRMAREYYRDYEKLYSRVFPVYDHPRQPGAYEPNMTLRPLRRYFKADNSTSEASLLLFPEGGNLVAGVPNRVAFEVADEEGKHLQGTVTLTDNAGRKIAEAKTEQRGRGTLEFTPDAKSGYTATFVWDKGSAKTKLPKVETDGVALIADQKEGQIELLLAAAGTAAQENLGLTILNEGVMQKFEELGIVGQRKAHTISTDGLRKGVLQLTIFNAEGRIYADRLIFVRGTETEGRRLTFSGVNANGYEPFAAVNIGIEGGTPGSSVSVAVRDAAHSEYTYDNGNILTEMLLASQIRGFVENPTYYFEKDDAEHRRALDLLLMIQGWRRYDWHTMATPRAFTLQYMPETTQILAGEVNKYEAFNPASEFGDMATATSAEVTETEAEREAREAQTKTNNNRKVGETDENTNETGLKPHENPATALRKQDMEAEREFKKGTTTSSDGVTERFGLGRGGLKREVMVHAEFTQPGAQEGVVGDVATKNARFNITAPKFYDTCFFTVAAADTSRWDASEMQSHNWVAMSEDENEQPNFPEFYVRLTPIFPRFVKPYNWYQTNLAEIPKGSVQWEDWMKDGSRTLQEITVGRKRSGYQRFDASKPAFVIDAYQAFNDACDAGLCTGLYMGAQRFIQDVVRTYIGDMNMHRAYDVQLRRDTHNESYNMSNTEKEKFNHLPRLKQVYIYTDYSPRREGDKHFEGDNQPEVIVDLRRDPNNGRRVIHRDRRFVLQGYAICEDFYQPDYSQRPAPEVKDYRRTLFWNPNVQLDASGKAELKFYNNGKQTQIGISAEGLAADGTLQTGAKMPEDK